ncbi:MAG TPA: rhomboid family intramembrane serine protease [Verrucomicrobiae bacterium]|nr:rhomboid family intramembrane serine protease [Verrucomicrobiae bacterium]
MLEDRDYMRQPDFGGPRVPFTVVILIVNALVFVAQMVGWHLPDGAMFEDVYFALSLEGLKNGYLWQLLTFQFMHVNIWHLLFNSLAIFFFGRPVEQALGSGRFLALYFLSGTVGGLVQMLFALIPAFDGAVVGASAGASGLIAAFALLNWHERFTLLFYFIPITMKGRTLLWASLALALVGLVTPRNGIANGAHLGGILAGVLFTGWILRRERFAVYPDAPREFAPARAFKKFWHSSGAPMPAAEDLPTDEFLQNEVDPILDKISAHGIGSLTKHEREILEKARNRMGPR